MKEIFVDSSALFVWWDHVSERGKQVSSLILQGQFPLVTTSLVFAETISLVTKRLGKFKGIDAGETILTSSVMRLVYLDDSLQREAWQFYKKYKDKDFDFIDATSFVFCKKRGIKEVLTLDHHFSQMGFKIHP
ncbi:MAG: type II toxin-antitoxin system VapC family toxin [Deltaproteobacteria bacterium]|nr:type II toxin-antitoxin system VapC family toxin [Deltaproteobacteria bacterium]